MSTTETHAEHTVAEHAHGEACGHETVAHDDHVDLGRQGGVLGTRHGAKL